MYLIPYSDGKQCATNGCKKNRHWSTRCKTNPLNYYCKNCQERIKKQTAEQNRARAQYMREQSMYRGMLADRAAFFIAHTVGRKSSTYFD